MAEPVHFQHFEVPLREDGSLHELGRGAMGITYKAFDTNLRCFVALKVINAAYLSSDVARQRFLREARAAAALRHPNVATVFHLGEEGGDCFYAMEFVDGETVEAMMKRDGAIPAPIALEIVGQVARALGAAHKQGLVHRDIKPSNLMIVREDDSEFTVKVIDFGLAKSSTGSEGEDAATLTVGGFLGTPHFASPEQLDERELDVRSDIYSLGVTLFYMLAGRAPFSGSLAQVMSQHLHREPPLETLSNQPAPVVELLRHMLAKDPAARPQTPADLRHEVETCLVALKAKGAHAAPSLPVVADNFETQVLEEPVTGETAELVNGSVLAGRYRLIEEVRSSDFGRVFKAESLETPGPVAILVLDPSLLASSEACTRIEDQVVALQKLQAPALQKILFLERLEDNTVFLVLEWIEGPSLLDLMRARKALPAQEARPLLRALAPGFQALHTAGISCPDVASRAVILCGADLSRPVTEWPQVAVKFNPISPGSPVAPPDATLVISAFGALVESGAFCGNENRAYVYALGSLAYEMLGGVRGGSSSGGTVPIPGLPEVANNALRRAMDPSVSFESVTALLDELESGMPILKSGASARPGAVHAQVPQASPPPLPAPGKSHLLIMVLAVVALAVLGLLGGGGDFLLKLRTTAAPPQASPTPAATAAPSPSPTPSPEPTPDPVLAVLAKARETAQSDPATALAMLVELQKSHPDLAEAKDALKEFLSATIERRDSLTPDQIAALRNPLEGAAALNFVDAQILLGRELRETDPESALKWTLAAANNGSTGAMLSAGLMLSNDIGARKKNFQEAFGWFQRAAKLGDHHAMFLLGECYQLGKGVAPDSKMALEWATQAATHNEVHALNQLGDVYNKGLLGVKPDLKTAFAYFSLAKDLGFPDAYGNLGALYITATPELRDEKMAVEIFKQGIEKENPLSMRFYAMCLEQGRAELLADKAGARQWYIKAAEKGDAGAQEWCRKNQVPFSPPVRPSR